MRYPLLDIDLKKLYENAALISGLCAEHGIQVAGVIKGFGGLIECSREFVKGGCSQLASSRIEQLKRISQSDIEVPTLLLRSPMMSEIEDTVAFSDMCLITEKATLLALEKEARKRQKVYKVILMYDVGDLREGIFDQREFVEAAVFIEKELDWVVLEGVGSNFTCYGSVVPTVANLTVLCALAEEIEGLIGRELALISGGATTTLPLVVDGTIPKRVNHLRVGEAISTGYDLRENYDCVLKGQHDDVFTITAQIIEVNAKPTFPIGRRVKNSFSETVEYVDRGVRRRALIALGHQDIGDSKQLIPLDPAMEVYGDSSDHTILDIQASDRDYQVGDLVTFKMQYQAILYASTSEYVRKRFV
ncbi:alanine racemase [Fundicoccus culcitae]|uniref:Alanine racemase n=1 Tax=Fundicoccus culcitae TaxID=2969821 RepID=A0ABY5P454_9LACT|nr:alanine racemase [Fundicoccus culcitae]UUX33486.1 alanine racemase [Fundicoccus culcitae]